MRSLSGSPFSGSLARRRCASSPSAPRIIGSSRVRYYSRPARPPTAPTSCKEGSFTLLPEVGGEAAVVAGPGTLAWRIRVACRNHPSGYRNRARERNGAPNFARDVPEDARKLSGCRASACARSLPHAPMSGRATWKISAPHWPPTYKPRVAVPSALYDPGLVVRPIAVAQQPLVELARRQPRQLRLEVDRARHLLRARCSPQNAISSSTISGPGSMPGMSCTTAFTSSPRSSFGTPNTAASATFGWVISRFSHSCG